MPSKRKQKTREENLSKEGWFVLSEDMWREPGEKPRKVRLVADANFPFGLVEILKRRKIEIKTAQELGLEKLSDEDLLARVGDLGYLLITMDKDFWSDGKFPLHKTGGIVFIEGEGAKVANADGFQILVEFLISFGGVWSRAKFRASSKGMYAKTLRDDGRKVLFEVKPFRPLIYAREVALDRLGDA